MKPLSFSADIATSSLYLVKNHQEIVARATTIDFISAGCQRDSSLSGRDVLVDFLDGLHEAGI